MTRCIGLLAAAGCLLVARSAGGGELAVEPDKENVVASRLEGTWVRHASLTERLTGSARRRLGELTFKSDPSVAGKIPEKDARVFTERKLRIYLAGYANLGGREVPFVLTAAHGNPHVVFWLERDGDPFGNGESFNVILAPAEDKQHDLLFTGGDFNNEPFKAFERKQADGEE